MRWLRALLACMAGIGIVLVIQPVAWAKAAGQPNFVIVQTDDQPIGRFHGTWQDLSGREHQIMPYTMGMLRDQGIEFTDYMTPFPLCAPSRASLLSGQYAHNSGVVRIGGERGGWAGYQNNPVMGENLAVWLQRAGYRTSHFGKFMNFYGGVDSNPEQVVPPGWDRWYTDATDNSTREGYGYTLNVDGAIAGPFGWGGYGDQNGRDPVGCPLRTDVVCNYHEDSISQQAVSEIANAGRQPFYVQVDYHTPHGDSRPPIGPEPPVRYVDTAIRTPMPRPPGFDETNINDKPLIVRTARLTSGEKNQIAIENQKSIEALRAVDDGVRDIVNELKQRNILKNTYFIFTSDNGYFVGEHRFSRGKLLPYEPALRVPMVIRGPGIRKGTASVEPMANQDIAPTLMALAGSRPGRGVDGRSMIPYWKNPKKKSRRPILISSYQLSTHLIPGDYPPDTPDPVQVKNRKGGQASAKAANQNYVGIRLGPYKYVEYESGDGELYVLSRDPAEQYNRYGNPRYARIQRYLDGQLEILRGCKGSSCRAEAPRWPGLPGG